MLLYFTSCVQSDKLAKLPNFVEVCSHYSLHLLNRLPKCYLQNIVSKANVTVSDIACARARSEMLWVLKCFARDVVQRSIRATRGSRSSGATASPPLSVRFKLDLLALSHFSQGVLEFMSFRLICGVRSDFARYCAQIRLRRPKFGGSRS